MIKRILQHPYCIRGVLFLCLAVACTVGLFFTFDLTDERVKPAAESSDIPLSARIANYDEVIASIRHGLRYHSQAITVRFSYGQNIQKDIAAVVGDWVEEALQETEESTEGDYIRYQYGGYRINCSCDRSIWGRYRYTVEIIPEHYTYLAQEEEVTEALAEIEAGFGFTPDTSDYEKIRTIYDYVCTNVKYDTVHKNNAYAHLRSTCYAAVMWHTATCQGYSVTLYRLLRDAGIGCRVITGTGIGVDSSQEYHAWNIVELEGNWYELDATWDAGKESYRYFLRGSGNFSDHIPGKPFTDNDFISKYTISTVDWPCSENRKE